jgi:hypothetical protein
MQGRDQSKGVVNPRVWNHQSVHQRNNHRRFVVATTAGLITMVRERNDENTRIRHKRASFFSWFRRPIRLGTGIPAKDP